MKIRLLLLICFSLYSQLFAIGGFGLNLNQGIYSVSKSKDTLKVLNQNVGIIEHHGLNNGYGLGGYLYVDALPFVDIDLEAIVHFSEYKYSFKNQVMEVNNKSLAWTDFAFYGTLNKKIIKLSIPFIAKAKFSAGIGLNNHISTPMINQSMFEAVLGGPDNLSDGELDVNEFSEYLKDNKISSTGFHLQTGIQFKLLMIDSFIFYRHVFVDDLLTDINNFGSINLRLGMGF